MLPQRKYEEQLNISEVQPNDFDELAELYKHSIICNPHGFIQDLDFHGPVQNMCLRFQTTGGSMIRARLNNQLVGMGALRKISTKRTELCKLHLHPDYQGLGYGKQMTLHLLQEARRKNFSEVELHVTNTQAAAIGLYDKLGFKKIKQSVYQTEINGEHLAFDTLYMECKI